MVLDYGDTNAGKKSTVNYYSLQKVFEPKF